ncbi:gliding motility-associated C-terminal domain-containing protein [Runella slithyformis]|nr:T9SS C-terminal target domain-containing protein [Runella slithyformis]
MTPIGGLLQGTAQKTGKYTYVVKSVAFQDTLKISEMYHEFQLIIQDCPRQNTPTIFASKIRQPSVISATSVCSDSLIQLNIRGQTSGGAYQWLRNNVPIAGATDSVFVVRNNQEGQYSLRVTNTKYCNSTVTSNFLSPTFIPKPTATVTAANPTGALCQGGSVRLSATTNAATNRLQWLRENVVINGATNVTFDAIESGSYAVRVTNAEGCPALSDAVNVVSNTPPKAEITASAQVVCPNTTITLNATAGTGFSYAWTRDGQTINNTFNTINTSQTGSYVVMITTPNGCSTTSIAFVLGQAPSPVVSISNPNGSQLCAGSSFTLTANGQNLRTYQWTRNGQNLNNENRSTLTINQAGDYALTVADTNGCTNTAATMKIELVNKITVTLDSISNFCGTAFAAVVLKGSPIGGTFSGAGVVGSSFDPKAAGVGTHIVSYKVSGSLACLSGEAKRTVVITPPPVLNLGPDRDVYRGSRIKLNGDLGAGYTYQWTPPLYLNNPQSPKPMATPDESIVYRLRATGPNNCVVEDDIALWVVQLIYTPDVFSPNGDGINDSWEIKGLEAYPDAEISIYNRWGNIVFYAKGNNLKPFDGFFNGEPLPTGVYVYSIKINQNSYELKGKVVLMK